MLKSSKVDTCQLFPSPHATRRATGRAGLSSEVPFLLLLLHRPDLIVIDRPALAFGAAAGQQFQDDLGHGAGVGKDAACQRIAAQRAEAHHAHLGLAPVQRHAVIVDHDDLAVMGNHGALGSKVERHQGNVLAVDILPDIQLGQIAIGKTLTSALELASEVENLAAQYVQVLSLGKPKVLGSAEMQDVLARFKNYGQNAQNG